MSRTAATAWTGIKFSCDTEEIEAGDLTDVSKMAADWLYAISGGRVGQFTTIEDEYWTPRSEGECVVPYKDANGDWQRVELLPLKPKPKPVSVPLVVTLGYPALGYLISR